MNKKFTSFRKTHIWLKLSCLYILFFCGVAKNWILLADTETREQKLSMENSERMPSNTSSMQTSSLPPFYPCNYDKHHLGGTCAYFFHLWSIITRQRGLHFLICFIVLFISLSTLPKRIEDLVFTNLQQLILARQFKWGNGKGSNIHLNSSQTQKPVWRPQYYLEASKQYEPPDW